MPSRDLIRGAAALSALLLATSCAQVDVTSQPTREAEQDPPSTPSAAASGEATASAAGTVSCSYPTDGSDPSKPVDPPAAESVPATGTATYTFTMTNGKVTITLDRAKAPCTVNNFISLADQGFYTGTRCHRLVDVGMSILQCGDPTGTGRGGPGYRFADELTGKETYSAGTVAMANAGPDTNGSQFFFVFADTDLGPDYTVFGTLDKASLDVIGEMAAEGADPSSKPINPSEIADVSAG